VKPYDPAKELAVDEQEDYIMQSVPTNVEPQKFIPLNGLALKPDVWSLNKAEDDHGGTDVFGGGGGGN
jgi:hypothetical protein